MNVNCGEEIFAFSPLLPHLLQGWEFAHRFSEQIARFLSKNEQMSDSLKKMSNSLKTISNSLKKMSNSLKKMSDSLIRSFLVSNLSDSLTVAHYI